MAKFRILTDEELSKALFMAPHASAIKVIESHIELRAEAVYLRELLAEALEELEQAAGGFANVTDKYGLRERIRKVVG